MHPRIIERVANRIHLFAHRISRNEQRFARTRSPHIPRNRIQRGKADKPHPERRSDALGRRHGDAHAGERAGSAAARHARDVATRDAVLGKQFVDMREQLRVGRAMCAHLD